jgi:elongation factor G
MQFMAQIPIGLEDKHKGIVDLYLNESLQNEGSDGEKVTEIPIPADIS